MYLREKTLSRLGRAAPPTAQPFSIPASVGGINAVDSLMTMPPQDCIYTYNLMPSEYGLRLRMGYREWATGCTESPARGTGEVRSIIPFEAKTQDQGMDRLFAVTDEGIWDVSLYNSTAPDQVAVFTELGEASGRGVSCEFTGDAADSPGIRGHYLFYADGVNGLWQYTEDTDAWVQPTSGVTDGDWYSIGADGTTRTAFPVNNIAFVMVHKQRIWVVLENDDDAWYLPLASVSGELKRFFFGSKFPHGGFLMGLYNWTIDGGAGVDDMLLAVSRGGDAVVYKGDDPEIAVDGSNLNPWQTVGAWFVGQVPNSRRIVQDIGGDLFLLSVYGLSSLRNLMQGAPEGELNPASPSHKINRYLRADVETGNDLPQWQIVLNPSDGFLQIITPSPTNTPHIAYNINLTTTAWGLWEGVPITCAETWGGNYFMGAALSWNPGTVFIYDGPLDGSTVRGIEHFIPAAISGSTAIFLTTEGAELLIAETGEDLIDEDSSVSGVWTQPVADGNDYECNNPTASAGLAGIDIDFDSVVGVKYSIEYTVETSTPAAYHGIAFGLNDPALAARHTGTGTFVVTITADTVSDVVTLIGGPGFVGSITDISVRLAPAMGAAIDFRTLTAFQALTQHAQLKRVGIARTIGILAGAANFAVKAIYDYQIEQKLRQPPPVVAVGLSVWDSAVWDSSTWDFTSASKIFPVGVLGMGRAVAVGIRGSATTRINIVGWDLIASAGGLL